MALQLVCSEGHEFKATRPSVGNRIHCPECGAVVILPKRKDDPESPAPKKARARRRPEDSQDEDAAETGRSGWHPMELVAIGVSFHYAKLLSYLLLLAAVLLIVPTSLGFEPLFGAGARILSVLVIGILGLFVLTSPLAGAIGSALSLYGMPKGRGKIELVFSLCFDFVTFAVVPTLIFNNVRTGREPGEPAWIAPILLMVGATMANFLAWMFHLLFLRRLAKLLEGENSALADEPIVLLLANIGLQIVAPAAIYGTCRLISLVPDFRPLVPLLFYLGSLVWLIFWIKLLFWNLDLMSKLRKAIELRLPK